MKSTRSKTHFVCQECGYRSPRWTGRCPECGQWDVLREEVATDSKKLQPRSVAGGVPEALPIESITQPKEFRLQSGLEELNRVLGGGVVPGSVTLIGGDPGIGKNDTPTTDHCIAGAIGASQVVCFR